MMWITVNNQRSVEVDDEVVRRVLAMYPEEELANRPVYRDALESGCVEFNDLKEESSKVLIPWQLFLLDAVNLQRELDHIDAQRLDKVSAKLMAKRQGSGSVTSKRIIDRLIRLQNHITENVELPANIFCGSLIGKSDNDAVAHIIQHFNFDMGWFRKYKSKASALNYLIQQVESKNVNICQGVLTNKILPTWQVVSNSVYKNTSGFVIKDDKMPFVFLPSEVNPNETDGRQIYTLIYLLVLIGLNEYNFFLEKDFKATAISATGKKAKIHRITSELLLPYKNTEPQRGKSTTSQKVDEYSAIYKITPTAILVTLKIRAIINQREYETLLPPPYVPPKNTENKYGHPKIETSVRKFCGKHPFEHINAAIKSGIVKNIRAQYLLFGYVNKKSYAKYREALKI